MMNHNRAVAPFFVSVALSLLLVESGCNEAVIGSAQPDAGQPGIDAAPTPDADDACQGAPVQDWYLDADDDGYGDPAVSVQSCEPVPDHVTNNEDCNDGLTAVNPEGVEICGDFLDNDCVGGDPCTNSMVGHWWLNDGVGQTATDSSGNGNDGSLVNGAGWSIDGMSANFVGDDEYIVAPHDDVFSLEEGTIMFWFRTRNANDNQGLLSKDASGLVSGGHIGFYIDYEPMLDVNELRVRLQSTDASYYTTRANLDSNTWYHVAFSFGPEGMVLLLDNQEVDTAGYTGGLDESSGGTGNVEPWVMGANANGSDPGSATPNNSTLDGLLRDVRVFERALQSQEIADIYELTIP